MFGLFPCKSPTTKTFIVIYLIKINNNIVVRKNWMLGFLGFMGFQGIRGIISGDWLQALWIVWFVWFIYFIPEKKQAR